MPLALKPCALSEDETFCYPASMELLYLYVVKNKNSSSDSILYMSMVCQIVSGSSK